MLCYLPVLYIKCEDAKKIKSKRIEKNVNTYQRDVKAVILILEKANFKVKFIIRNKMCAL